MVLYDGSAEKAQKVGQPTPNPRQPYAAPTAAQNREPLPAPRRFPLTALPGSEIRRQEWKAMKRFNTQTIKRYLARRIEAGWHEARGHWREMVAAEAPAGTLAAAFAIGTLISTIPVPLVDMALAAWVTRRFNAMPRAPFFGGMALANNLFMAPLYASTPRVGGLALGSYVLANTGFRGYQAARRRAE